MAGNTSPIFVAAVNNAATSFANADGTAAKTVFTAGANGSRVQAIAVVNTDTAAYDVVLSYNGATQLLGRVSVPLSSGNTNAAPTVNLLASAQFAPFLDADGSLRLPGGVTLQLAMGSAIAAGKSLFVTVLGGDF